MIKSYDKTDNIVWYDNITRLVYGTGNIHLLEIDGVLHIDSVDWKPDTQTFIQGYSGIVEGEGPWYYWDGRLRSAPPPP